MNSRVEHSAKTSISIADLNARACSLLPFFGNNAVSTQPPCDALKNCTVLIIRPQRKLFTPVFFGYPQGWYRMTSCQPLGSPGGRQVRAVSPCRPPLPPRGGKSTAVGRVFQKSPEAPRNPTPVGGAAIGDYSGTVRERFRHRSSKFIARRPPQCRALMKTKSTCNFSLKSSALTEK